MFKFASPEYLYLLILIPLFIGFFIYRSIMNKKKMALLGDIELINQLMPMRSEKRMKWKFYLTMFGLLICVILLARPQFGTKLDTVKRKGVEVIVALDVSNSMMANDVEPNRLEKAKRIITKVIDDMHDDKVGLIVFAGDAFTQIPITSDFISAKMFMPSISPSLIPIQGTAIGTAIDMATHSFAPQGKGKVGRSIIVITDGENHEDDAVEAAKAATKEGINVCVVGVGSTQGAPIPLKEGSSTYKTDREGNVVVSKLNEAMCQEIAKAGDGVYVRADNTNNAQKVIQKHIDSMAKAEVETKLYSEYSEQFQFFAGVLFFILLLEVLILERKNKWLYNIKLF